MTDPSVALAQSVQARLLLHARKLGVDPNLILARYATERFLYRLSQSPHAEQFVLKGRCYCSCGWGRRFVRLVTQTCSVLAICPARH